MGKNIYIVGFMGTGKSTIGKELARATGRRFLDMDRAIEQKFSMSINAIFDNYGEDFFRNEERELAFELVKKNNFVVSTGCGTIMDKDIYRAFRDSGIMVCLVTKKQELVERLVRTHKRPVLRVDAVEDKIDELLKERSLVFNSIPIKVDTTDIAPMEIVRKLVKLFKIRDNLLFKLENRNIEI